MSRCPTAIRRPVGRPSGRPFRRALALALLPALAAGALAAAAAPTAGAQPTTTATATNRHAPLARSTVVHTAARYATSRGYHVGIAVFDRQTHHTYTSGAAHGIFASESVVKVFIATRLLVTGRMYGRTAHMAWKMITRSDDNMATDLYYRVGGDNLINWVKRHYHQPDLGYPPTHAGWWGNTHITPAGLVHLYGKLARDRKVGPWLLNAMHHARRYGSDGTYQFYGLPSATKHAAIKQGWGCDLGSGCNESDFNTTGFINDDRYAVAILARGPLSDYGTPISNMLTGAARALLPRGRFPAPPPQVAGLSRHLSRTSGGGILRVRGRNFVGVRWVQLGTRRVRQVQVLSPRRLAITLPAHVDGSVPVRIGTIYGTSRRLPGAQIRFVAPPSVRSAATRYVRLAGGGRLTLLGHDFIDVRAVRIGGVRAEGLRVTSPRELSVRLPEHAAGPVNVRVITRFGKTPAISGLVQYVGAPTISGLSPDQGDTTGGTAVTITGTQFVHVRGVRFGKADATDVRVLSPTSISVIAPQHSAGTAPVHVLTGFGRSDAAQFTYTAQSGGTYQD